jgi:hypothetical protein
MFWLLLVIGHLQCEAGMFSVQPVLDLARVADGAVAVLVVEHWRFFPFFF